jgi:hypothetical protein
MMRAIVSELLQAVNGTISRSGRSGQFPACAHGAVPSARAKTDRKTKCARDMSTLLILQSE